jgi:hypothetical protein
VIREVERRAVRLADRVSPGIVWGGLPGPVWTTPQMLRVERAIVALAAEPAETPRLSVPETAVARAIAAEAGRGRGPGRRAGGRGARAVLAVGLRGAHRGGGFRQDDRLPSGGGGADPGRLRGDRGVTQRGRDPGIACRDKR